MQLEKLKSKKKKKGFLVLAKHGLNKTWIRAKFGLSFLRDQIVEREREEEQKERKRRRGRRGRSQKGMELTLCMDSSMDIWILYGILEKFMSSKPRV